MKKTQWILLLMAGSLLTTKGFAQNVAINEDGSAPNPNAILDVKSATKGVLIPRTSSTGRLAIPNTKGLLVFDTTTASFWYNTGSSWQNMAAPAITSGSFFSDSTRGNTGGGFHSLTSPSLSGFSNSAFGINSMTNNTTGFMNTGLGDGALFANTTGDSNAVVGDFALPNNTTGGRNTVVGSHAMESNRTGHGNTAIGLQALDMTTGGSLNTAVGLNALQHHRVADGCTAVGSNALINDSMGVNNTAIGIGADVGAKQLLNATAIGAGAIVDASNKVRIGNNSVTVIEGAVPFTTPSDARFKNQIQEDVKGLDFILQLRPVTYHFNASQFGKELSAVRRSGFIAQEVEQAAKATGYDFSGVIRPQTSQEHYSLSYESFVVPLVKAIQDQQEIIADLQRQINELKKQNSK